MIFIFPTHREAARFKELAPNSHVEVSGVGIVACGATCAKLATLHPTKTFILAGIAGSYDTSRVEIGECIEVLTEIVEEMPQKYQAEYSNPTPLTQLKGVKSNCVNRPAQSSKSCEIENMEGAALFATCQTLDIKYAEIRAISNRVGEPFSAWRVEEAIESLTVELLKIAQCE